MWSEEEIRIAATNWRAAYEVQVTLAQQGEENTFYRGLAEGYASALEMILGS